MLFIFSKLFYIELTLYYSIDGYLFTINLLKCGIIANFAFE